MVSCRVPEEDQIFFGAAEDSSLLTESEMCKCSFMIAFGVQCDCGYDLNVDLCDFDTSKIIAVSMFYPEWNYI